MEMTEKEKRNGIFRTEKHKTKIKIYLGIYRMQKKPQ